MAAEITMLSARLIVPDQVRCLCLDTTLYVQHKTRPGDSWPSSSYPTNPAAKLNQPSRSLRQCKNWVYRLPRWSASGRRLRKPCERQPNPETRISMTYPLLSGYGSRLQTWQIHRPPTQRLNRVTKGRAAAGGSSWCKSRRMIRTPEGIFDKPRLVSHITWLNCFYTRRKCTLEKIDDQERLNS